MPDYLVCRPEMENTPENFSIAVLILCSFILCPSYGYCQEIKLSSSIGLSLQEAVNLTFKNNREIKVQEEEIGDTKNNKDKNG